MQKAGSYLIIFLSFRAVGKKPMVQAYSIYAIKQKRNINGGKNHEEAHSPAPYRSAGTFRSSMFFPSPRAPKPPLRVPRPPRPQTAQRSEKIGVFEPASGDNGAGGKQETLGMQYANYGPAHRGDRRRDLQCRAGHTSITSAPTDKAPSAAADLVSSGRVASCSAPTAPACPLPRGDVFDEAGMPAIGVTCTNPQVTAGMRLLLPHLLPRSLPGHRSCQLSPSKEFGATEGLLPGQAGRRLRPAACATTS